jgi:hypothetical protein
MHQNLLRLSVSVLAASVLLAGCNKPASGNAAASNAPAANAAAANTATPPAPANADAQDAADVKAFLVGLYAHYKSAENNNFSMFNGNAKDVFDPDMLKLLAQDAKLLHGEVGAIDGDFLCNCQDFVSIQATINVQWATPTQAHATADFTDSGMPDQPPRHNIFDLDKTAGVWRIHDITDPSDPTQPSLRTGLLQEIATYTKGAKPKTDPNEAP